MEISRSTSAILILLLIPVIRSARWQYDIGPGFGWCKGSSQLFEGDFNGDGMTDLLCHRPSDGYKWISFAEDTGYFTGTSWKAGLGLCNHDGAELHIGDFNGDGRSNMMCHNTNNGYKSVSLANGDGHFSGNTSWEAALDWCYHSASELHIGDFNGDGRDDMLCHDSNGYKWISYASSSGSFSGTNWVEGLGWCYHSGSQLFIGDFNGDSKSDLLCHDSTGYKWIAYANSEGNFHGGTYWQQDIGWCWHSGEELYIGDFNGDGMDDMLCHNSGTGYKRVVVANCLSVFAYGTSWGAGLSWCNNPVAEVHVGDYNGDGKTDMLCHDPNSGNKWIIYAELTLFQ